MADQHSQQSQEIPSQIDLTSYLADVGIFSECLAGASGRDVALWASEHVGAAFGWARSVEQTSSMIMQEDDAEVDEELRRKIEAQAFQAHRAMHARDFSLYDVRISPEGEPYFLEACNFCSFSPKSAMVAMANAAGRQHPQVFEMCLDRAAARKHAEQQQERVIGMGAR